MKNRNLENTDSWATPVKFYAELDMEFGFDFDPCPYEHDITKWDGLLVDWGNRNFVNPPYSRKLKEAFVKKAWNESLKGKLCVLLLPVSTSTDLFHNHILGKGEIRFIKGRLPFTGINTKGQCVNFKEQGWDVPEGMESVKNSGMHDSMLVIFDGRKF